MVSRTLIIIGLVLVVAGILWPWLTKIGVGRLPGDISIQKDNFRFYFPITTSILISILLTFIFWLFRR